MVYTKEQKEKALALYQKCKLVTEMIRQLEYPSGQALYTWIEQKLFQKEKNFNGYGSTMNRSSLDIHLWH